MTNLLTTYGEKLKQLSPNVSLQDKADAKKAVGISRPTIEKYLNGNVVKMDTADKLIKFFSKRILRRVMELEKA
jgi:predicted transcriptional regulator